MGGPLRFKVCTNVRVEGVSRQEREGHPCTGRDSATDSERVRVYRPRCHHDNRDPLRMSIRSGARAHVWVQITWREREREERRWRTEKRYWGEAVAESASSPSPAATLAGECVLSPPLQEFVCGSTEVGGVISSRPAARGTKWRLYQQMPLAYEPSGPVPLAQASQPPHWDSEGEEPSTLQVYLSQTPTRLITWSVT